MRITKLGLGVAVHRERLTVQRLAEASRGVLEDETITATCRETGRRIAEEDGAAVAADVVEALAGR